MPFLVLFNLLVKRFYFLSEVCILGYMSFNRLSTEEIDELKHMVRRELSEAENRLMTFLPNTSDEDDYADVRKDMIDNLNQRKSSMHSILGKLDRFHQSEIRRFYQPDHYNNYNNNVGYSNNSSSHYHNNYNGNTNHNYNHQDSEAATNSEERYRSNSYSE